MPSRDAADRERFPALTFDGARLRRAGDVPIAHAGGPQYMAMGSRANEPYWLRVEEGRRRAERSLACPCPDAQFAADVVCKHKIAALGLRDDPRIAAATAGAWRGNALPEEEARRRAPYASLDAAMEDWRGGNDWSVASWMLSHRDASTTVFRFVAERATSEHVQNAILSIGPAMADAGVRRMLIEEIGHPELMLRLGSQLPAREFRPYFQTLVARGWAEVAANALRAAGHDRLWRIEFGDLVPLFAHEADALRETAREALGDVGIARERREEARRARAARAASRRAVPEMAGSETGGGPSPAVAPTGDAPQQAASGPTYGAAYAHANAHAHADAQAHRAEDGRAEHAGNDVSRDPPRFPSGRLGPDVTLRARAWDVVPGAGRSVGAPGEAGRRPLLDGPVVSGPGALRR